MLGVKYRLALPNNLHFLRGQLALAFQMIAMLAVTRCFKAQCADTGRGLKLECFGNYLMRNALAKDYYLKPVLSAEGGNNRYHQY